jgi:outer membrane receptor protein involved in Fe transport
VRIAIALALVLAGLELEASAQTVSPASAPSNQSAPPARLSAGTHDNHANPAGAAADVSNLSLEDLLDIDVTTASKFAEKQSDAPGIISVLSSDDLKRFGGTTLSDVLDRVPGLNVSSGYLTDRSTIAARGDQVRNNSGHILLLVNGRPVRETMEGGLSSDMFERFPLSAIDRIEVIKGPGSVLYGSDAFSGVINIITKNVERTGLSVSGLVGSNGTDAAYDASATSTLAVGDLQVLLSARYLEQPRWRADYLFKNTPTSAIQTLPIDGPDKGPGAYLDARYGNLRLMAAYTAWNYWYQLKGVVSDGSWTKAFVNLGYGDRVLERWNTEINVGYTNAGLNFTKTRPFVERHSDEIIAEWTNFIDISRNARVVVGALLNNRGGKETNDAAPITVTTTDKQEVDFQSYAQIDYRPWRQLKLIGGVQVNKIGDLAVRSVPRVGFIVSPTSRLNFKLLYSAAYRAPSIDELFGQDVNLRGNPALEPETVQTFDYGVSYQGEQVQLGASYFHSKQENIIRPALAPGATGTNGLQIYTNGSGVVIQGVDAEAKAYVTRSVYLTGSILYQRSENDLGQVGVTPIPSVSTKAGASYASDNGIIVSLFDVFEGEYGSQFQGTLNPSPKPHNELDLHGNIAINDLFSLRIVPAVALQLQVNNLLNEKYYIPEWGGTVHDSIPGTAGRTFYCGATLSL